MFLASTASEAIGEGNEEGTASVHRWYEPSREVKAIRLEMGENSRPVTTPSGLLYLYVRNVKSVNELDAAYRATTCRDSLLHTMMCVPAAETRYRPFGDHASSPTT